MAGSTTKKPPPAAAGADAAAADAADVPGRYLIVQPAGTGLTMMVDTVTGQSWFRISAGPDHYAWRPMRFEESVAHPPPR